ncbi:hypothetical protein ACFY2W_36235 [Streptomyces sp. NPDC001262]|uniref:hypothetical protein n=1 Tax=Streptomyces sp. NPDC001262 TaxID=3364552 RepID=UPI0036B72A89
MIIERSTLVFVTVVASLVAGWAAWAAARSGHDAVTVGSLVYGAVAALLAKVFGGSAVGVIVRSLLLLAGGVLGTVASLLLHCGASIRLTPTTF